MKLSPRKEIDSQLVYLDPFLVDRARVKMGLALKQLAVEAEVDYRTLRGVFDREGILPSTAREIAEVLNHEVLDLLAPWDPRYITPPNKHGPFAGSAEWDSIGYLEQGRQAPNGLYYIVCHMRHRHSPAKYARGKFYHLSWLPAANRETMRYQLSRHADVCALIGIHPHVAVNHTSTPVANSDGWWVIDEWVGEHTLADHLGSAPWPDEKLPRLLHEVARGLQAIHASNIVLRELAPARVLISDRDGHAVLTDFELAKLLDGSPSVSTDWPEDPFRAPELDGGMASVQADLYSFGQLVGAALAGPEFDPAQTCDWIRQSQIPRRLQRLLVNCTEPSPESRKTNLSVLLAELERWAKD